MDNMITYLNGVACNRYGAILLHREITPVTVRNYNEWIDGAVSPMDLKESTFSYSKITLKYFVEGENEKDTLLKISNLIKAHIKTVLKFSDLNLKYNVKIENHTSTQIKDRYYEVTIVLMSDFKLDQDKAITINNSRVIECTSNVDTPARLTITSEGDYTGLVIGINDDTINVPSIKTGDILIIDGNDYLIKYNGEDNLNMVDLWRFPVLKSGENNISINKANISLKIEYTERFI